MRAKSVRLSRSLALLGLALSGSALQANGQQNSARRESRADSAIKLPLSVPGSVSAAEAAGLKLLGVYDDGDGHWIAGATIRDTLGDETSTSSMGVAILNTLTPIAGYYLVEVRKPGYVPRQLRFRADTVAEVMTSLEPNPLGQGTLLAPVIVAARRQLSEDAGTRDGFLSRCQTGFVACVGAQELNRHTAGGLDALLSHVDGIGHRCSVSGGGAVTSSRSSPQVGCLVQMQTVGGTPCVPVYMVNGIPWAAQHGASQAQLDQFLNASNIEGIEVYLPAAPRPVRFDAGPSSSCGTIVIWTR